MRLAIIEREIYHKCQRGELRAKGSIMFIMGKKGKFWKPSELLHNIHFSLFVPVLFWKMGSNAFWNKPSCFPVFPRWGGTKVLLRLTASSNGQVPGSSAFRKSLVPASSLISFICKWTYTVGLAPNDARGTRKKLAQDNHYFKRCLASSIPLCLLRKTKWNLIGSWLFPQIETICVYSLPFHHWGNRTFPNKNRGTSLSSRNDFPVQTQPASFFFHIGTVSTACNWAFHPEFCHWPETTHWH